MKFDSVLIKNVKADLNAGLNPMLLGEPGIGKSSWVQDLTKKELKTKCFVLPCNQLADKADLTGARLVPVTDKQGNIQTYRQEFYPHAVISQAIQYAKDNPRETPILFMDEINRTTPDVTSEALSIPTLRSIGSEKLPDNLRVMLAGNDKGNVISLDEASISRFVLYHVVPDTNTFLSLDKSLNTFIKTVLTKEPSLIFCKTINEGYQVDEDDEDTPNNIDNLLDEEEMAQITTPRTISGLSQWLNQFNNDEILAMLNEIDTINGEPISILEQCVESHVGHTQFAMTLLHEIAESITKVDNQENTLKIEKPDTYDNIKEQSTLLDMEKEIEKLTNQEISSCLLYALYEQEDNTDIIASLAKQADKGFLGPDGELLTNLALQHKLDSNNVESFIETQTNVSRNWEVVLRFQ